jgi:predicted tellurium resistance membrane protein TerC
VLIDIVFSFDSILTAVGLSDHVEIMIGAVIISMSVMMIYARRISVFINRRPTLKMLALSFLILIGLLLVAEAFDVHVPKGMVYFGMVFALGVEILNQKMRKKAKPVKLRGTVAPPPDME